MIKFGKMPQRAGNNKGLLQQYQIIGIMMLSAW